MTNQTIRLSGDDWQVWANKVLSTHYGPLDYQQIPDKDRGDAGLEGFTRNDGHAYQAYGCEEPISVKQRYEKQRNKMTQDIAKFINNEAILLKVLGNHKISRWALFVPLWDSKELNIHAEMKAKEVRELSLPYVADDFEVCVCDKSSFALADAQLIACTPSSVRVDAESPSDEKVANWQKENEQPSAVLTRKLKNLPTLSSESARVSFQRDVLDWYLRGQELLDELRVYPDVYQKVLKARSQRERYLVMGTVSGLAPHEQLTKAINELCEDLQHEVRELHQFSSESLAYAAVAEWLLRCPLNFPEVA